MAGEAHGPSEVLGRHIQDPLGPKISKQLLTVETVTTSIIYQVNAQFAVEQNRCILCLMCWVYLRRPDQSYVSLSRQVLEYIARKRHAHQNNLYNPVLNLGRIRLDVPRFGAALRNSGPTLTLYPHIFWNVEQAQIVVCFGWTILESGLSFKEETW